jgi:dimethylhistidine N-methyltransferase
MPNDSAHAPHRRSGIAQLALEGLRQKQKTLPPKLFYDEEGCRLFYEITRLPEYYLTRTELALLERVAPEIAEQCPSGCVVVEYGASDEAKVEFLLRQHSADRKPLAGAYIPIDIAAPALSAMAHRLHLAWPALKVHPIIADFLEPLVLPRLVDDAHRLGFFPGSTIGNLEPQRIGVFLEQARATLGLDAQFLIGVDLRKDPTRLIAAYDDKAGVTAAFNRNVLVRLNREARANFDPDAFAHRAVWNDRESRIEMHLISLREQAVEVDGEAVAFRRGESIHTENSYKFSPEHIALLATRAGWRIASAWNDNQQLFALCLLRPDRDPTASA